MPGINAPRRAAVGALWGLGTAGIFSPRLADPHAVLALMIGALSGVLASYIWPRWPALSHPGAALLAALCGLAMLRLPEPTFFLLVPLLASAVSWPLGPSTQDERPLPRWLVPATFVVAAAVFFFQSAHRHWTFASGGKDLGLFYQTHWLIAHRQPLFNTVMGMHVLADHMTFVDFLIAPLLRVFDGAETLLLFQAVAVASAVFPLYALGRRVLHRDHAGYAACLVWLLSPDVHMGVMFDYNQTPFASAGLVWTAWALVCRGPLAVALAAAFTCAAKTNFPLYVAVLALVLAFRLAPRRRCFAVAAFAVLLFGFELAVLFPRFREGGFRHWEFEELGDTPGQVLATMAMRPDRTVRLLADHAQKRRSLLQPLAATGFVGMADPISLTLQLPNWGERFLSTHRTRWWGYYYGMPAVATALVGLFLGWRRLDRAGRAGVGLPLYLVTASVLLGTLPPYRNPDGERHSPLYSLRRPYAASDEDVRTQRAAVAFIGRDPRTKVAAQYHLLPHLAGRPFIVMLDRAAEADVVALQLDGGTWPQGRPAWKRLVQELWMTGAFHVGFCQGESVVLVRGAGPDVACLSWEAFLSGAPLPASPTGPAAPEPPESR